MGYDHFQEVSSENKLLQKLKDYVEEKSQEQLLKEESSKRSLKSMRRIALEGQEMGEHKDNLSEKRKQDVDLEEAMMDYAVNHGDRFDRAYKANQEKIYESCDNHCGENKCKGFGECDLPMEYVHMLLRD